MIPPATKQEYYHKVRNADNGNNNPCGSTGATQGEELRKLQDYGRSGVQLSLRWKTCCKVTC